MSVYRKLVSIVLGAVLLGTIGAAAAAQEEAPPMPPPGERFEGFLTGSVSFVPDEECPFGVLTVTDGSGMTTLGMMSVHAEHCATPGAPSAPDGWTTLTSEAGDEIGGPYFIDCEPILPTEPDGQVTSCPGRFVLAEGSGAYAEVSGTAYLDAYVWFPGTLEAQDWPWVELLHGSIDY